MFCSFIWMLFIKMWAIFENVTKLYNFLDIYCISRKIVFKENKQSKNGGWLLEAWQPKPKGLEIAQGFGATQRNVIYGCMKSSFLDSHLNFLRDALSDWRALFILLWFLLSWSWNLKEIQIFSLHKYSGCPPLVWDGWQCDECRNYFPQEAVPCCEILANKHICLSVSSVKVFSVLYPIFPNWSFLSIRGWQNPEKSSETVWLSTIQKEVTAPYVREERKKVSPGLWTESFAWCYKENTQHYIHEKLTRIIANKWKQHANNVVVKNTKKTYQPNAMLPLNRTKPNQSSLCKSNIADFQQTWKSYNFYCLL